MSFWVLSTYWVPTYPCKTVLHNVLGFYGPVRMEETQNASCLRLVPVETTLTLMRCTVLKGKECQLARSEGKKGLFLLANILTISQHHPSPEMGEGNIPAPQPLIARSRHEGWRDAKSSQAPLGNRRNLKQESCLNRPLISVQLKNEISAQEHRDYSSGSDPPVWMLEGRRWGKNMQSQKQWSNSKYIMRFGPKNI